MAPRFLPATARRDGRKSIRNGHGLKVDAVFLRAFMTDDVGAGDQCGHHRFGGRWPHVGAIALPGFIDDRLDVAYGNLCARVA